MKNLALAILSFMILVSCGTVSTQYPLVSESLSDHNSGVILFRTENINHRNSLSGFSVEFHGENGETVVKNVSGLSGYPNETEYAFRVPAGTYKLARVFFYDGAMQPIGDSFSFTVEPSQTKYIGTILKSWGLPKAPQSYGEIVAVKPFSRKEVCLVVTTCDTDGEVIVVNEGVAVFQTFFKKYPSLSNSKIRIETMQ